MRIRLDWNSGYIDIDADAVIEMKIVNYRIFMKLFEQYGTSEQHRELLDRLQAHTDKNGTKGYRQKLEILKMVVQKVQKFEVQSPYRRE